MSEPGRGDRPRGGETTADRRRVRRVATWELSDDETRALRSLLDAAFGTGEDGFSDDDWDHALGGVHFVVDVDGRIVAHAAVVERELEVDGRPLRTGYVEAVAVAPDRQGQGLGLRVMRPATEYIDEQFELGALGTGSHGFYERLGWRRWQGPSWVRTPDGLRRTADEDGYIMVRLTSRSPELELTASISCEWRPGDAW